MKLFSGTALCVALMVSALQLQQASSSAAMPRIVNGQLVDKPAPYFGEWEFGCGSTLIHDDFAISAAHCYVDEFSPRLFFGGVNKFEGAAVRQIMEYFVFPTYEQDLANDNTPNDIVLLKLNASALGEPGVALAPMNRNPNLPVEGQRLLVMGYGKIKNGGAKTSDRLRSVHLNYTSNENCAALYDAAYGPSPTPAMAAAEDSTSTSAPTTTPIVVPEYMLCAYDGDNKEGGNPDACEGKMLLHLLILLGYLVQ